MKGLCMVPSTEPRYGLYSIDISIPCSCPQFPYLRNVFLPHTTRVRIAMMCFVSQTCSTLCNPTDCSPPGSSVHGILQSRILEWLPCPPPGIVPTQGQTPGLPHGRQTLHHLSHQESQRIPEWVACPFSRGSSQLRNQTGDFGIAGGFFTS